MLELSNTYIDANGNLYLTGHLDPIIGLCVCEQGSNPHYVC